MNYGYDHLTNCDKTYCEECERLLELYTACDSCGHWMNNECEHYYNQETGETLCGTCEPKHVA